MVRKSLSDELQHLLDLSQGRGISLQDLAEDLNHRGHAVVALTLSLPFVLPIPLPGVSTPVGLILVGVGLWIAFGLKPWLPFGLARLRVSHEHLRFFVDRARPFLHRLEKVVRPRGEFFATGSLCVRAHGLVLTSSALLLALPAPPGGNVLPALSIICICVGLLESDSLILLLGYLLFGLSIFYFSAVISALWLAFQSVSS